MGMMCVLNINALVLKTADFSIALKEDLRAFDLFENFPELEILF